MRNLDYITNQRKAQQKRENLLNTYQADLTKLRQSIAQKKSSLPATDEALKAQSTFIIKQAEVLLDGLDSYVVVINNWNDRTTDTDILEMVSTVIALSQALLDAQNETERNVASIALLQYAQKNLTPHPTWGGRIAGAALLLLGVLLAAFLLAAAALVFMLGILLAPAASLTPALIIGHTFFTTLFGGVGLAFGAIMSELAVNRFLDRDVNKALLNAKLIDFNGAFFSNPGPQSETKQTTDQSTLVMEL